MLFREFIRQTLTRHSNLAGSRTMYVWPADRVADFEDLATDSWCVDCQTDGDLGRRMRNFFQRTLDSSGVTRAVLIGSDSPRLPVERIHEAFTALHSNHLVLGPSQDGGYYLIGMSHQVCDVFEGVTWSSPEVFEQTVAIVERQSLKWHRLPEHNDIDDIEDLRMLEQEIASEHSRDPLDQQLLEAIQKFGIVTHE